MLSAASIIVELQKIVSREIDPLNPVVLGIGVLEAGTRYNIVASHGKIEGTVRTFNNETRAFVLKRIEQIATQVVQAHRTKISHFSVYDAAAPLINEKKATKLAEQVATKIVGEDNVITDYEKSLGADDFADFLAVAPGVYGRVGTRKQPRTTDTIWASS